MLDWFQFNPWITIAVAAMLVAVLVQCWFYIRYFSGINHQNRRVRRGTISYSEDQPPVSIIICARDKGEVLAKNLPALFDQKYPEFQIVVVNDASSDETEDILQQFEHRPNFYHTFVPKGVRSISARKMAMTLGLKAAVYDYVLFMDVAGIPESDVWIATMMRNFDWRGSVVLGFASFKDKKGFRNQLVAYDNLFSTMQWMGLALSGKPYRATSVNLAFKKELFFKNNGFASNLSLRSGDDDLLIGEIATRNNVKIEVSTDSKVEIETRSPWYDWKEKTFSLFPTARQYKFGIKLLLWLENLTRSLCYLLFLYLIVMCWLSGSYAWFLVSALLFLTRYAVQLVVVNKSASQLKEPHFYLLLLLFDASLPVVRGFMRLFNRSRRHNNYTWEVLR